MSKRKSYTSKRKVPRTAVKKQFTASKAAQAAVGVRRMGRAKRQAVYQLANQRTAGFLGIESKFFDLGVVPTTLTGVANWASCEADPAATLCLSCPAQGDGEQSRDGKKCVITSVQIAGVVTRPSYEGEINPPGAYQVFLALVLDTQTNGAQLNSEDVYVNTAGSLTAAVVPDRNLQYSSRFRVLRTWTLDMTPVTMTSEGANLFSAPSMQKVFEGYVGNLNIPVNFTGTTAVVTNVVDNSLHLVFNTNNPSGATHAPTLCYNSRIRFQG